MNKNTQGPLSRRTFMKGTAAAGGGIAAMSFASAFGMGTAQAAAANDDIGTIANLAATAETLAVTFYYAAITGAQFDVDAADVEYLKLAMDAEQYHLDILASLGGKSLTQQFYVPANVLSDPAVFIKTGLAPNDLALNAAIYYNVSDAVPTLAPFLKGGAGFIGPVSYPTKAQFDAALGGTKAIKAPPYAKLY